MKEFYSNFVNNDYIDSYVLLGYFFELHSGYGRNRLNHCFVIPQE